MEIEELIIEIEELFSKTNVLSNEISILEDLLIDFRIRIINENDVNTLKSGYNYFLKWRELSKLKDSTIKALDNSIRLLEKHIKKFDLKTLPNSSTYNYIPQDDSLYDYFFDPNSHFLLKTNLKENVDRTDELNRWTGKVVTKPFFLPTTCFEYYNPDSNRNYISNYMDIYIKNEKYNFKWLIRDFLNEHPNCDEINIAIAGGGNLFEIKAINEIICEECVTKLVNVYVFDKKIWSENIYTPDITTHINKIELFEGDFFEVLKREELPNIDIYVFARCLVFGELFQSNNIKTDEEGQKKFCEKVAELMEFLLQFNVKIATIQCENGELTSGFKSKLLNFLNDNSGMFVEGPFPSFDKCPSRESRMYYITKRNV